MTCSGCKLTYELQSNTAGTIAYGTMSLTGGHAIGPVISMSTLSGQTWATIQHIVYPTASGSAAHGVCQTGVSGCVPVSPCVGIRGIDIQVTNPYTLVPVSTNANSINPFNCGEQEYLAFYGTLSGVQVTPDYRAYIHCTDC